MSHAIALFYLFQYSGETFNVTSNVDQVLDSQCLCFISLSGSDITMETRESPYIRAYMDIHYCTLNIHCI